MDTVQEASLACGIRLPLFCVTMFFPVFTQKIVSVVPEDIAPGSSNLVPSSLSAFWSGILEISSVDLSRASLLLQSESNLSLVFSILRAGFIPLYFLCNIENNGAIIESDVFYLFAVQLFFGMTNGWLGSCCMMDFADYVEDGRTRGCW